MNFFIDPTGHTITRLDYIRKISLLTITIHVKYEKRNDRQKLIRNPSLYRTHHHVYNLILFLCWLLFYLFYFNWISFEQKSFSYYLSRLFRQCRQYHSLSFLFTLQIPWFHVHTNFKNLNWNFCVAGLFLDLSTNPQT